MLLHIRAAKGNQDRYVPLPGRTLLLLREQWKSHKHPTLLFPAKGQGRFLQHTLPRGFARVRSFGWLHPAAKVRANRVRALLHEKPLLTAAEKQTWNPPSEPTLRPPPPVVSALPCTPRCPRCLLAMKRIGSWHAGQAPLQPRPPP